GLNPDIPIPEPASLTDSRDAMVAEVRRQVKYGADWIKLYATGTLRHVDPATLEPLSQVSIDDVKAVVAEAKRWHRDVAAHAYGGEGAKNAIRGGVRSIEHGMLLDDEALKLMLEQGTYWVPTLSVYHPQDRRQSQERVSESDEAGREDRLRHRRRRFRARYVRAGVRPHGRVRHEAPRRDPFRDRSQLGVAETRTRNRHDRTGQIRGRDRGRRQ